MIRLGLPLTAETYADINWWGDPPEDPDEEDREILEELAKYEAAEARRRRTD